MSLSPVTVSLLGLFTLSSVLTYTLIWLVARTPLAHAFSDVPGNRKVHQRQVPRVGGLCAILAFLVVVSVWHSGILAAVPQPPEPLLGSLLFLAICILLVGIPDDSMHFQISNRTKLLLEAIIAAQLVVFMGLRLEEIHLLDFTMELGWFAVPVTVLWLVAVGNAINIIDGVDGLAGSTALISLLALAALSALLGASDVLVLCLLCAGLPAGFLVHNVPPARVFLGDTGSLFLGMLLGAISVHLISSQGGTVTTLVAVLVVGFPLLDIAAAMVRRFLSSYQRNGSTWRSLKSMTVADAEHMHHRLMFRGLSHAQTCVVLGVFSSSIAVSAIVLAVPSVSAYEHVLLLIYLGLVTLWFFYRLNFFDPVISSLRQWARALRSSPAPRWNVVVVNSDAVLRHALSSYSQDRFSFTWCVGERIPIGTPSAILLNNEMPEALVEDLALAYSIGKRHSCPIVIATDTPESVVGHGIGERRQKNIMCVRKPLYVPVLLADLAWLLSGRGGARTRTATRGMMHPLRGDPVRRV